MIPYSRVLAAPACEPVSLEQAKAWCKVDNDDEDELLELLIQAARERAEDISGCAFIRRQLEQRQDHFPIGCNSRLYSREPANVIKLLAAPLISVEYINYLDADGALQTLSGSPTQFLTDCVSRPGRVMPLYGQSWPATQLVTSAVRIGYTCGYAPVGSPTDDEALRAGVPAVVKKWMHSKIVTMFDKRDELVVGQVVSVPREYVDGLLDNLGVNNNFA